MAAILTDVPFLHTAAPVLRSRNADTSGSYTVLGVNAGGTPWDLLCVFEPRTELRHIRNAIYRTRYHLSEIASDCKYAILLGPYISQEGASLLRNAQIGFVDLAGNRLLSFDKVYVACSGSPNPIAVARRLRSIFAPRFARVLIAMLREPHRAWQTQELAKVARVSAGHVSNLKKALLDREWVKMDGALLRLSRPDELLDAWRDAYEKRPIQRLRYHTLLHGRALEEATHAALQAADAGAHAVLSSYSAARWMAPYVSMNTTSFYADATGAEILREKLQLESVPRGENVLIETLQDEGVLFARVEAAPRVWTTNPIQTYLDLSVSGERGAEAAEHLRSTKITPTWSKKK